MRSKYATLVKVTSRDWLETKRATLRIFYDMGKPIEIKADKDSALMCTALQVATSKTGISDI